MLTAISILRWCPKCKHEEKEVAKWQLTKLERK